MALPTPAPDRTAVVTGASSGIGAEVARDLVRRGHQVVLVARTESKLAELAAELGEGAHVVAADLSDRADRAGLLDRIAALGLTPDILVNNAGLSTLGPVHRSDPEAEMRMVEVDVVAVVDLCSRFLPGMVERGTGAVLNVASTAAFQPLPGQAGYGAGKVFVLSYSQSLSAELKGKGVSVTVLCPGPVDTGFGEAAGFTKEQADDALPAFMWIPADRVAREALDGLASGKLVVIPGVGNKVGAAFAKLAPRRILLPILAKQHPGLK
jgi:short-subunit dehydrogenase